MDCRLYNEKDDGLGRNVYPHSYAILRPKVSKSRHLSQKRFPALKLMDIPISKLKLEDLEQSRETIDRLQEKNVVLMKEIVQLKKRSEELSRVVQSITHVHACVEQRQKRKKRAPLSSPRRTDCFLLVPDPLSRSEKKSSLSDLGPINCFDGKFSFKAESKDEVDFVTSRKGTAKLYSESDRFDRDIRKITDSGSFNRYLGKVKDSGQCCRSLGIVTDSTHFSQGLDKVTDSGHVSQGLDKVTDTGHFSQNVTRSESFDPGNMSNSKAYSNGWLKITDSGTIKSYNSQDSLNFVRSSVENDHKNSCSLCEMSETKLYDQQLNLFEPEIKYSDLSECGRPLLLRDSPVPLDDINIKDSNLSQTTVSSSDFWFPMSPSLNSQSTPQSPAPQYYLLSPDSDIFSDETTSSPNCIFPRESIEFSTIEALEQILGPSSSKTSGGIFSSNVSFDASTSHTRMNMYRGPGDFHRHHRSSALRKASDNIENEMTALETNGKGSTLCLDSQHININSEDVKELQKKERNPFIISGLIRSQRMFQRRSELDLLPPFPLHNYSVLESYSADGDALECTCDEDVGLDNIIENFECEVIEVDDVCQLNTEHHKENKTESENVCLEALEETRDGSLEMLAITVGTSEISLGSKVHNDESKKVEIRTVSMEVVESCCFLICLYIFWAYCFFNFLHRASN